MALIAEASTTLTGLFLALFVQRVTQRGGRRRRAAESRCGAARRRCPRADCASSWRSLPALAFVGLADVAANGTYSSPPSTGPVTVAAVLASLYPVVTALAARGCSGSGCARCRPPAPGSPWWAPCC